MILVLLGTQSHPFNRLINELIAMEEAGRFGNAEIVIQAGSTQVDDPRFVVFNFIRPAELDALVDEADLIIAHGGLGSIFSALRKHKKVIALARSAKQGEHVDEHQFELVEELFKDGYLIGAPSLSESFALLDTFVFKKYRSSRTRIVKQIEAWLEI